MPPFETLLAFFLTTAVFAYVPGPAMLYATAQTIARGRWSGLMASLGIHLGGYAHVIAAAAGLSALFHAVPSLYLAVKLLGAVYLIWLGIRMFRARLEAQPEVSTKNIRRSGWRAFAESVSVEVLNPKTALFFLAFLPQFVDPSAALPVWMQLFILGTVVNLMFTSADVVCVLLAGALAKRLKGSARVQKGLQRAGGTILVGLGLNLALQKS
ncbi:LysE family translocator [Shinella sedimenti]|uniref:LysE family translocator n=1 Tax=Shinella sedimenti TaxID=2919913 RepID=A0ABT0CIS7_9HYPH|nr:LysE family translocator [Shinella sedimenti]MCJ8148512.1 LysE family translocator [Shinella sedimenti]